jgi:hypothetical protein
MAPIVPVFFKKTSRSNKLNCQSCHKGKRKCFRKTDKGLVYIIEEYFKEKNYFEILQDPTRVFNGDETCFQLCPKEGKVIAPRGTKHVFCTHSLESNASNIQRSLRNECFPVDSNVKIAKNTGPLRHSKKNLS